MVLNFKTRHILLSIIVLFSLILKFLFYTPHSPCWDESSYVLMGKYIFSNDQIGLLEPFRPVLWPVILGGTWKMGMDPFVLGSLLQMLFGCVAILLVFLLGSKVFDLRVGMGSALFFSLSPAYFYWGNHILTDIPASCLGLWAVYLAVSRRYFFCGAIGALAFLMKYTQAITIGVLTAFFMAAFFLGPRDGHHPLRNMARFLTGLVIVLLPFFAFSAAMYGDALKPFADSKLVYGAVPYRWNEGIIYCLNVLFYLENFGFIFMAPGLLFLCDSGLSKNQWLVLAMGILQFVWIAKLPTEIQRFLISALPYLYILAAAVFFKILDNLKRPAVCSSLLGVLVVFLLWGQFCRLTETRFESNQRDIVQQYVARNERSLKGSIIWISNPRALIFSDLKASELLYYPALTTDRISRLQSRLSDADFIFIDNASLRCVPPGDPVCFDRKRKFFNAVQKDFHAELISGDLEGKKATAIFKRRSEIIDNHKGPAT